MPRAKKEVVTTVLEAVEPELYTIPVLSTVPALKIPLEARIIKHRKTVKREAYNELDIGLPSVNRLIEMAPIQGNITTKKGVKNRWARSGPAQALIAKTRKRVKEAATATLSTLAAEPQFYKYCLVVVQVYFPDRRVRDAHNMFYKPGLDGLSDAGVIGNDRGVALFVPLPIINKGRPRVEFLIFPMADTTTLLVERD